MTQRQKKHNETETVNDDQATVQSDNKKPSKKSILKPLFFFAVFALCIEAAVLYPFFVQKNDPLVKLTPRSPTLVLNDTTVPMEETLAEEQDVQESPTETVDPCPICKCDCPSCADSKFVEQLQQRIHELEIENLSLKEQNAVSDETTPIMLDMISQMYQGRPFQKQLDAILKKDKMNHFALTVQKELGNYASKGIPNDQQIAQKFTSKFQMALDSFYMTGQKMRTVDFIKSSIHIYPENLNSSNAEGVNWLYLARQQVQQNDFQQALLSIDHLPQHTKKLFYEFIDAVNARTTSMKLINLESTRKETK